MPEAVTGHALWEEMLGLLACRGDIWHDPDRTVHFRWRGEGRAVRIAFGPDELHALIVAARDSQRQRVRWPHLPDSFLRSIERRGSRAALAVGSSRIPGAMRIRNIGATVWIRLQLHGLPPRIEALPDWFVDTLLETLGSGWDERDQVLELTDRSLALRPVQSG